MAKRKKYELVADELAEMINSGAYGVGTALPSVRSLSLNKNVSITTVLKAYYTLEARGLVKARSRSGFYVAANPRPRTPEPEISSPKLNPALVNVLEQTMKLLQEAWKPGIVPFGAAYPAHDLMAANKLGRLMSAQIRKQGLKGGMYDLTPGCEALRVQIARHSTASGCNLSPEEIITTTGCTEAITIALRAVCEPGDTVAIESPICMDTLQCLEILGLKALEIPTHPRDGISLEALEFALQANQVQACLVIANFNNPLGSLIPDQNKEKLVKLLAEHHIPLIEDDIFGDIHFADQRPKAAKAFDSQGEVLLCSSFSKTLSPGYRVGWIAPGAQHYSQAKWLKHTTTQSTALLPQLAVADFLASGGYQQHLRRARRVYQERLMAMRRAVIRHFPAEIRVTRPEGGYVLWVQLPLAVDSAILYERALDNGISIVPGYLFSASKRYRNFIRLNAAVWQEDREWAVQRLGALIRELDR